MNLLMRHQRTYVFVDLIRHLFRETAKIDSITVASRCNDEFLLSFVLDELRAEFFSMGIYAILIRTLSALPKKLVNSLEIQLPQDRNPHVIRSQN
jgi:hypothetical protein